MAVSCSCLYYRDCAVITDVLKGLGIDPDVISYISETDRKYVDELMHLNEYVDVIIPRGGAGLFQVLLIHLL